jgi:hypothetical protein
VDIEFVALQGGADTSTPSWNVLVFHQGELFSDDFVLCLSGMYLILILFELMQGVAQQ